MIASPVTFVILVLLALLLAGGIMLIRGALRQGAAGGASGEMLVCPHCRRANPADAQYCSHCGSQMS